MCKQEQPLWGGGDAVKFVLHIEIRQKIRPQCYVKEMQVFSYILLCPPSRSICSCYVKLFDVKDESVTVTRKVGIY
jgi:hypothetical protein